MNFQKTVEVILIKEQSQIRSSSRGKNNTNYNPRKMVHQSILNTILKDVTHNNFRIVFQKSSECELDQVRKRAEPR